uniref:Uncharacterized protein n=1 Tax=Cacopsylla melanoneura TaxID=428564 RepID=A0A8D8WNA2_9HEMI
MFIFFVYLYLLSFTHMFIFFVRLYLLSFTQISIFRSPVPTIFYTSSILPLISIIPITYRFALKFSNTFCVMVPTSEGLAIISLSFYFISLPHFPFLSPSLLSIIEERNTKSLKNRDRYE